MPLFAPSAGANPILQILANEAIDNKNGTWAFIPDASQKVGGYLNNTTVAVPDSISYDRYFKAGTYKALYVYQTRADLGIVTLLVGGAPMEGLINVDCYTAGTIYNVTRLGTGTAIAEGFNTVSLQVAGKNASSSANKGLMSAIIFERIGA